MANEQIRSYELIDRMSLAIQEARPIPLTQKIVVDRAEMEKLLRLMEESLPVDVQTASKVLEKSEQLLADSTAQAQSLVKQANEQAENTVNQANEQATGTVNLANQQAAEVTREASERANAMVADAQARAQAMIADAQAQANNLVAESEIVARAQAQAQEMLEATRRECDDYSMRIQAAVNQMMERVDVALVQQLDSLRTLHQEINMNR